MANIDDILLREEEPVNEEELMRYVSGQLSQEERHAFEAKTMHSDFMQDAMEGLSEIGSTNKLTTQVSDLNQYLHRQLKDRKQARKKRGIGDISLPVIAVVVILLLCVLAYVVLRFTVIH